MIPPRQLHANATFTSSFVSLPTAQAVSPLVRGYEKCRELSDGTKAMARLAKALVGLAKQQSLNAPSGSAEAKALNAQTETFAPLLALAKDAARSGEPLTREVASLLKRQAQGGPPLTAYEEKAYSDKLDAWHQSAVTPYKALHAYASNTLDALQKHTVMSAPEFAGALIAGTGRATEHGSHPTITLDAQNALRSTVAQMWRHPAHAAVEACPDSNLDANLVHSLVQAPVHKLAEALMALIASSSGNADKASVGAEQPVAFIRSERSLSSALIKMSRSPRSVGAQASGQTTSTDITRAGQVKLQRQLSAENQKVQDLLAHKPGANTSVWGVAVDEEQVFGTTDPRRIYLDEKDGQLVSRDGQTRLISGDEVKKLPNDVSNAVRKYWEGREVDGADTRLAQLQAARGRTLQLQADLAVLNGSLTAQEKARVDSVLAHPTLAARQAAFSENERPGVFAIHMKKEGADSAGPRLAGAFIITARDSTGPFRDEQSKPVPLDPGYTGAPAILYTPDKGFERFDDLWKLHDSLAYRMKDSTPQGAPVKYLPQEAQLGTKDRDFISDLWRKFLPVNGNVVHDNVQSLQDKETLDTAYAARTGGTQVVSLEVLGKKMDEAAARVRQLYQVPPSGMSETGLTQQLQVLGDAVPVPSKVAEGVLTDWLREKHPTVTERGLTAKDLEVRVTYADGRYEDVPLTELYLRRVTGGSLPDRSVASMSLRGPLPLNEQPGDSTESLRQLLRDTSHESFKKEVEQQWDSFWRRPASFSEGQPVRTWQTVKAGEFLQAEADHRMRNGALSPEMYRAVKGLSNPATSPVRSVVWHLMRTQPDGKAQAMPGMLVITQGPDAQKPGSVALWHRGAPLHEYANIALLKEDLKLQGHGELQTQRAAGSAGNWWAHDMRKEMSTHLRKEIRDITPVSAEQWLTDLDSGFADIIKAYTAPPALQPLGRAERERRMESYAAGVKTVLADIEKGSEAERNVKLIQARSLMTPTGYFSGGLSAAGYDPFEKFAITYKSYVHSPDGKATLHNESTRTYAAWEIAAGMATHDSPSARGVINSVDTEYASPEAKRKVLNLSETGKKLQASWQNDVVGPIREGTHGRVHEVLTHPFSPGSALKTWEQGKILNRRSGQADAYSVRATLQSLRDSPTFLTSLSAQGRDAVNRTLTQNGPVIIPNVYGYPMEGFAFIPYGTQSTSPEHRPNQGLLLDLRTGKVANIRGDDDFARWADKNHSRVMLSFNAEDMQGDPHRLDTWPAAEFLMSKLKEGRVNYQGVPVRELFNHNRSDSDHTLKRGTLDTIGQQYEAVNTKYTSWLDQTQVFGASQQRWKAWKEVWDQGPSWVPIIGNTGNLVFGIHDSVWGPTVEERSGGSFAAFLAALQLAHEVIPGAGEAEDTAAVRPRPQAYAWTYRGAEREFTFERNSAPLETTGETPEVRNGARQPTVQAEPTPPAINTPAQSIAGTTVLSDLGKEIGRGGEAIVYESRDGKSVYKAFDGNNATKIPQFVTNEAGWLNKYYGDNFARAILENGKSYIKMPKLEGKPLSDFRPRSLPANVADLLARTLTKMEDLGIHHQDLQLKNFIYSQQHQKVYPVDIQSLPEDIFNTMGEQKRYFEKKNELLNKTYNLVSESHSLAGGRNPVTSATAEGASGAGAIHPGEAKASADLVPGEVQEWKLESANEVDKAVIVRLVKNDEGGPGSRGKYYDPVAKQDYLELNGEYYPLDKRGGEYVIYDRRHADTRRVVREQDGRMVVASERMQGGGKWPWSPGQKVQSEQLAKNPDALNDYMLAFDFGSGRQAAERKTLLTRSLQKNQPVPDSLKPFIRPGEEWRAYGSIGLAPENSPSYSAEFKQRALNGFGFPDTPEGNALREWFLQSRYPASDQPIKRPPEWAMKYTLNSSALDLYNGKEANVLVAKGLFPNEALAGAYLKEIDALSQGSQNLRNDIIAERLDNLDNKTDVSPKLESLSSRLQERKASIELSLIDRRLFADKPAIDRYLQQFSFPDVDKNVMVTAMLSAFSEGEKAPAWAGRYHNVWQGYLEGKVSPDRISRQILDDLSIVLIRDKNARENFWLNTLLDPQRRFWENIPSNAEYITLTIPAGREATVALPDNMPNLELFTISTADRSTEATVTLPESMPKVKVLRLDDVKLQQPELMLKNYPKLESVELIGNPQITSVIVSEGLPSLREIKINNNPQLSTLEVKNSFDLRRLDVTGSPGLRRVHLTEQMRTLQHINLSNNGWTSINGLESNGLPSLTTLNLSRNQLANLEGLPEQLGRLNELDLSNNQFRSFPDRLWTLSQSTYSPGRQPMVILESNPFSDAVRNNIETAANTVTYQGPQIVFSRETGAEQAVARPLTEVVASWYERALPLDRQTLWSQFDQEDSAKEFSAFLDRLRGTPSYNSAEFRAQVRSWLEKLEGNEELRQNSFIASHCATDTCDDRVALAYNNMKQVLLNDEVKTGKYDEKPVALREVLRGLYRLELLEEIARKKASTMRVVDPIEVYLDYQVKLRDKLQLPTEISVMRYGSGLKASDLADAEKQVRATETKGFTEYLANNESMQTVLERRFAEEFAQAKEAFVDIVSDPEVYRASISAEMAKESLPVDDDSIREYGPTFNRNLAYRYYGPLIEKIFSSR